MSSNGASTFTPGIPAKENVIVDGVLRYPAIGSKALVIGTGVAGMMAALECWRKGIEVEIIETNAHFGDGVLIGPSAFTTFHHYPSMLKEYDEISHDVQLSFAGRDGKPMVPLQDALTLGHPLTAFKTGFIVYRGMYSTDRLKDAPVAGEFIRNLQRPTLLALVANKIHCILAFTKTDVIIGITTEEEDDTNTTDSWSSTVSNATSLSLLPEPETWSPLLREAIHHAPDQSIVRWSLCFRNPQPCWTSAGGHVIQLGDSAHSFLPTSANGATQALEDALSLPECLRLGGREGLGVATKVHELLRYQRVSLIQHFGFINTQDFHSEFDQKAMQKYPLLLMGKWLWAHNSERHTTQHAQG
ncbi:hypothetical protein F4815DRAFT_444064 [Daldinia loculata]|nr:hypothetical protein F4815DRAFT_444064 [Daldinia loculata]